MYVVYSYVFETKEGLTSLGHGSIPHLEALQNDAKR
jgi:hypothetical protein